MKLFTLATPVLLLACAPPTQADDWYAGLAIGQSQSDFSDVDTAIGNTVSVGGFMPGLPLALEAGVIDPGQAAVKNTPVHIKGRGERLMLAYHSNRNPADPLNIVVKGGYYHMALSSNGLYDAQGTLTQGHFTGSSEGFAYAIGIEYLLNNHLALGGEIGGYSKVDYLASDSDLSVISVGTRWQF